MKTFLEFYDKNGMQMLGSDGIKRIDGRKNYFDEVEKVRKQIKNQYNAHQRDPKYIKPRAKYCKVLKGESLLRASVVHETIMIHDLF